MEDLTLAPDYLFEVSWEVCNKVGGIHTVIATKALNMAKELENRHILIGPDVWRETQQNPEFLEDARLLRSWRQKAAQEGLRIRVGRWNVAGSPIAILVDFSSYIARKDEIFAAFWEKFKLDSISGQWDYVEPALFGYATGKVIESYVRFNLAPHHKVVAQFHEWMTGTGLLYLKTTDLPIATAFTTHATVLGRCIAGNMLPLYDNLEGYNPLEKAREFNVLAKHSLEKTASVQADVFTTVSEITARECAHFIEKKVDVVTPNGFENSFTPSAADFPEKIASGRGKLREIAEGMLQEKVDDNAFLVGIGGRYEFKNKGIDVFIDALGKLDRQLNGKGREVLAFIMVPTGHHGAHKSLAEDRFTTHYLNDPEWDASLRKIHELGLENQAHNRVKIFFIPCYLNGNDGLINMTYYDLLVGLDLSVFPSYYEPWGYTPLESLAFKVPTVTTSLAGFGLWVEANYKGAHPGINIIPRNDVNYSEVVDAVEAHILALCALTPEEALALKENAKDVSTIALWENQGIFYKQAYAFALAKVVSRLSEYPARQEERSYSQSEVMDSRPTWSPISIQKQLPKRLAFMDTLSKNLWWSWNQDAVDLFANIDHDLWISVEKNPIILLDRISYKRYKVLEKDAAFLAQLDAVENHFNTYMSTKDQMKGPRIAYFSMEYGLDWSLKIYSGGLGILAGDYLKESSDKEVPIVAVGLLYRYGYFRQQLSAQGDQISERETIDFQKIPASPVRDKNDNWATISIALPGRNMNARIWRVDVGRTELYLLDTDFEDNLPEDRSVTYQLYGGDWENRLKQEILLGIGGIRALRALGKEVDVYHCNEGHAAFIGLERMHEYVMDHNLMFDEAKEVVRASSLFTTHTPVPAGHDAFTEDLLRSYFYHYPDQLKTSWETLMGLGKIHANDPNEKFSMSFLAANLSQEINGVSMLHGKVSQNILNPLWPGYLPEELHVSYVTNGVHYPTWAAREWKPIHEKAFGKAFATHHYDKSCFEGFLKVDDKQVWEVRSELRSKLIARIVHDISSPTFAPAYYSPREVVSIRETLRTDILTIGFARRFATYKRAHLLFSNLDRLNTIINNPKRPVQFLFAGKAHPADKAGQDLIKRIIDVSHMPQFMGKILFIPNYNMEMAKRMVQGVDVWMNTPTRPLEASGTSGEKASMNGVMHFSVLDGWWVEGYKVGAGWALPEERTYNDQRYQDELDAATIYNLIENEIAPLFYDRNEEGVPTGWVQQVKHTVAYVACNFTTNRMMNDYQEKYYEPLCKRYHEMCHGNFALAREMAFWKKRVLREWQAIEVISYEHPSETRDVLSLGVEATASVKLFLGDLSPEDVGVEMVITTRGKDDQVKLNTIIPFELTQFEKGEATYLCKMTPEVAGTYMIAARVYANNPKLPHRQDFALVKWL